MKKYLLPILLVLLTTIYSELDAQKVSLDGYVSGMYMGIGNFDSKKYQNGGLAHNRLNFKYRPTDNWELAIDLRTRAMAGNAYSLSSDYNHLLTKDNGLVALSWNIVNGNDFLLNSSIERFYVGYQSSNFAVRIGRQRINWSQTMVFNPNDIFNTYSFFDLDYPERAGSDAIRLSYFPSGTSIVEFVFKIDGAKDITAVGFYRVNAKGWDFQVLGGIYNNENILLGGGFSGTVGGINLRSELSYYYDTKILGTEARNTFLASLSADYIFANSLVLSAEVLYNSMPNFEENKVNNIFVAPMSAKQLSITPFTAVTQLTYQFSPILTGGISAMSYIDLPAFYIGPTLDVSLADNLTLSVMAQFLIASSQPNISSLGLAYLRLKYNF